MKRRNCVAIITKMLELIPKDKKNLISDLNWNKNDAFYKVLQWQRTMNTLQKHIKVPKLDWEFEVLSIFTTKTVTDLRKAVEEEDSGN